MPDVIQAKDWRIERDQAGGKSGLVSGVNMGKLLEDFQNAANMRAKVAPAQKLEAGWTKYKAGIAKKNLPKLMKLVDEQIAAIKEYRRDLAMQLDAGVFMRECLKVGIDNCAYCGKHPDADTYRKKVYDRAIRSMGQAFARLGDDVKDLAKDWKKFASKYEDNYSGDITDPAKLAKKHQTVAADVALKLSQIQSALLKRGIIAPG